MSTSLLEEYKAYYKTRAERYANNPNYKNSYQAEIKLSDAMQSCSELIEFRDKMGDLNERSAIALVKDKYLMRKAFYDEMKETVRVRASHQILAKLDGITNVSDLVTMVIEEENKCSIEISMDEAHRELIHAWNVLDAIEVYENAIVPGEYKDEMMESAREDKTALQKNVKDLEENNSHWESGWRLKPDLIHDHRHVRLLPYSTGHITEQLFKYKSIINR